MKIKSLLLKALIFSITLLLFSVSCAGNNDINVKEITKVDVEPIEEIPVARRVLTFKEENGLELKVSHMKEVSFGFLHTGLYNPEEIDHGMQSLAFRTFGKTQTVENIFVSPKNFFWSASGKWKDINVKDSYLTFSKEEMIFTNNGVITEKEQSFS